MTRTPDFERTRLRCPFTGTISEPSGQQSSALWCSSHPTWDSQSSTSGTCCFRKLSGSRPCRCRKRTSTSKIVSD